MESQDKEIVPATRSEKVTGRALMVSGYVGAAAFAWMTSNYLDSNNVECVVEGTISTLMSGVVAYVGHRIQSNRAPVD